MKRLFQGNSLNTCIKFACKKLNIEEDKLNYKVLKDESFLFMKKIIIEVEVPEDNERVSGENNGSSKIMEGKIIVHNPEEGGTPAVIRKGKNMNLSVDGREIESESEVFESSSIEVTFQEEEAARQFNIYLSDDKMQASARIEYIPKIVYKLKDSEESGIIELESEITEKIYPPKYTEAEIMEQLSKNKVVYGIIDENLKKLAEGREKIIVAQGKAAEDCRSDFVEIKFQTSSNLEEDKLGNVDFKSIGKVDSVNKGDILAIKHIGTRGIFGSDVNGKELKPKDGKKLKIKAGPGCLLKDENTIIAAMSGKPHVKGNTFYVKRVHEINSDVDLSTGNVCFLGDVEVHGSIKEGMSIECGSNLTIDRDVERAKISARGNILVRGSIVGSKICAGGEDVKNLKYQKHLVKFSEELTNLINSANEIKMYNLLGQKKTDGEIIKILLENKFKNIIMLCINIISEINSSSGENKEDILIKLIKSKLMGIAPISIEKYSELEEIVQCSNSKIEELKNELRLPVRLILSYCQDSYIESSGDVIVSSKGEYISNIIANRSIEFTQQGSVARGGTLKAKNEIKCRTVGSEAGVTTRLEVEDSGDIWADIAYHNTIFKIGRKEILLESSSKNVHAYLKNGNIELDKFVL
ncbi:DUF342 domain-containing protein [Clostridium tyrobutyricum]|uniref:DUF342 domain-containing protein n=1 Tax=Clostridium tyrobutyricum TaxID=1519 RepID=UPI001C382788|nr:flagellar assembly protein A [Clostridium tyrobutyricum]MBV4428349.1 DUF342 domain-containing protein [Clostridium tyrobutyricum]MBV4443339.1 DUF342 domain-containing protein [Clostridium tyrobutyricum]